MRKHLLCLAVLAWAGCGSEQSGLQGSGAPNALPSATTSTQQPSLGRAYLSDPVVNGRVVFLSLDGQVLGETTTDLTGNFVVPLTKVGTADYRAQIELAGVTLRSEVRGPQVDMLTLSPLTTVVSHYLEAHPGFSLAEAESRVAAHLSLPAYTLSAMVGESPYLSSRRLLQSDLRQLATAVDESSRVSFVEDSGPTGSLASKAGTALLDFSKDLGQDYLKSGAGDLIGWAANSVGINFLSPSLRDVGKQLDEIESGVQAVSNLITQGAADQEFHSDLATLNDGPNGAAFVIRQKNANLTSVANTTNPSGLPVPSSFLLNTSAGNLTSSLQMQTWQNNTDTLFEYLTSGLSGTNILKDQANHLLQPNGFAENDTFQFYSCRANLIFPPQQNALIAYLTSVATLGIILVGESSHLAADLAASITLAQSYLTAKNIQLQTLRQEVPATLAHSGVLLDLENKKMWLLQVQDKTDYQSALTRIEKYTIGPFDDWRIPKGGDLDELFDRQKAGNSSQPLQVLIALGFRGLSNENGDILVTDGGHHVLRESGVFVERQSLDTGNGEGANRDAYLMVRDFPGSAEYALKVNPLSCMTGKSLTVAVTPVGTQSQLKATGTAFRLRAGGNFKVGSKAASTGTVDITINGSYDVTDEVIWTSSNDAMASVSNAPGSYGLVTWHAPLDGRPALANVTITAKLHEGVTSVVLAPPASLAAVLDSIQISPYNVLYDLPQPGQSTTVRLRTTLFFKDPVTGDQTVEDGSSFSNVTYQIFDKNTLEVVNSNTTINFPTTTPGEMSFYSTNTHANVIVNATISSVVNGSVVNVTGQAPLGFSVLK